MGGALEVAHSKLGHLAIDTADADVMLTKNAGVSLVLQNGNGGPATLHDNNFTSVKIVLLPHVVLEGNAGGIVNITHCRKVDLRDNSVLSLKLTNNSDVSLDGDSGKLLLCRHNLAACGTDLNFSAVIGSECMLFHVCIA